MITRKKYKPVYDLLVGLKHYMECDDAIKDRFTVSVSCLTAQFAFKNGSVLRIAFYKKFISVHINEERFICKTVNEAKIIINCSISLID